MSNRLLRDWTDSEAVDTLSVHAERLFTRLIMKVDDYGRMPANTKLLKAALFPYKAAEIREAEIARWMAECHKAGLILLYEVGAKQYVQIQNFNQRLRQKTQKYPPPTDDGHVTVIGQTDDGLKRREVEVEEKRREYITPVGSTHTQEEIDMFNSFKGWISKNSSNVSKMKEPFTIEQYLKLRKKLKKESVQDLLLKMHNWKPLLQKNVSAYQTIINWSKKDFNAVGNNPDPELKRQMAEEKMNEKLKEK